MLPLVRNGFWLCPYFWFRDTKVTLVEGGFGLLCEEAVEEPTGERLLNT